MKIFDISWPITPEITEYKNKKTVRIDHVKTFERDAVRESVIQLGSHTGTHIDAPSHFIASGTSFEDLPIDACIGACVVIDCTNVAVITSDILRMHDIGAHAIVLCKTDNSDCEPTAEFNPSFVYLDASAAQYLAEKQIKAVGIDYLGIERNQPAHETHILLMQEGITIIEGLRLANVPAGSYELICLPLKIECVEAAPARAILISRQQESIFFDVG